MRATVLMADTSLPAPGSLTPIEPTSRPAIEGARNSALSSSLPKRASAGVAMSVCTPMAMGTPPQWMWPSVSAMAMLYE